MSKVSIEYDLSNEEDEMEMKRAIKSTAMALLIWELEHNFLKKWKHDDSDFNLDSVRKELNELVEKYDINVDELIN